MEGAKKLSHALIDQKLSIGVNMWPMYSMFPSKGECKEGDGVALLIRTIENKLPAVEDAINAATEGGIAMAASFEVWRISRAYKEWMQASFG